MKKSIHIILLSFTFVFISSLAGSLFAQDFFVKGDAKIQNKKKWVPNEILVKFNSGTSGQAIADINARHGSQVLSTSGSDGFKRLKIPKNKTVEQMVAIYTKNPNVEYAEPNFIASAFYTPNDPFYTYQWHMDQINMGSAWDYTSGAGVVIAVIDTGVAYEDYTDGVAYKKAPDLYQTVFVQGYDFVNNDAHPNDDEGHGTHVTGTIAQSTNNSVGVAGVAFNASIMPIKVLNSQGSGSYADIADGIYFAADNGAQVINMSLGGNSPSITLENALQYAYNKHVTIICASGNDGFASQISYPAAYDAYCIAVGATRFDEQVSSYSNRGSSLDLTAPGGDVTVDQNGDGYGDGVLQQTFGTNPGDMGYWFYQGTSMAAPHVAGAAALLIAYNVATTPDTIREALQSTAKDKGTAGWDPEYGWGIIDTQAALNYQQVSNAPPVADPGGPYSGTENVPVYFDGSASWDPDGDALTYQWDFGDGTSGSGVAPEHTYLSGGDFTVTLIVNDGKDDSLTAQTSVNIIDVNDPPIADAGPDISGREGVSVTIDGSGSYDPDPLGTITDYQWDFGDGLTGSGEIVYHTYAGPGTYTITLTVIDDQGSTGQDVAEAVISSSENPPPTEQEVVSSGEIFGAGTVQGSYENTWADDGIIETVTERKSGGRPSSRYSYLQHTWVFEVPSGSSILYLNAWSNSSGDSDAFLFSYSLDGSNFFDMLTVNGGNESSWYSYSFPPNISGTVHIRVLDTDRQSGNLELDTIAVDHLYIMSLTDAGDSPLAPSNLSGSATVAGQIDLVWSDNADDELGFEVERSMTGSGNWVLQATLGVDTESYSDTAVSSETGYDYRIRAYNGAGFSTYSNTVTVTSLASESALELEAAGYKVKGVKSVDLFWNDDQLSVDIYRDGTFIGNTSGGSYTDANLGVGGGSYTYQVCETTDPANCSNYAVVSF